MAPAPCGQLQQNNNCFIIDVSQCIAHNVVKDCDKDEGCQSVTLEKTSRPLSLSLEIGMMAPVDDWGFHASMPCCRSSAAAVFGTALTSEVPTQCCPIQWLLLALYGLGLDTDSTSSRVNFLTSIGMPPSLPSEQKNLAKLFHLQYILGFCPPPPPHTIPSRKKSDAATAGQTWKKKKTSHYLLVSLILSQPYAWHWRYRKVALPSQHPH